MRAVEIVYAGGWAAFWICWLVAAFSMKRGRVPWSREPGIRVLAAAVVIILLRLGAFRGPAPGALWRDQQLASWFVVSRMRPSAAQAAP